MNIESAAGPTFSPDGSRIAYLSNAPGTAQVFVVPSTGGAPQQITDFPDRVMAVQWSPKDPETLLLLRDAGGNERAQLCLIRPDGSGLRELTRAPKVFHQFGDWSPDGGRILYASNARNERYFDVHVMDFATGTSRTVYEGDGYCYAGEWSPDGRFAIVGRLLGSFDNDLYRVDIEGREKPLHLTPHEGLVRYEAARWSRDGRGLYLLSDRGGEFLWLARLDIESRELTWIRREGWDLEEDELVLAPDGAWVAFGVNRDGWSEVEVRNLPSGVLRSRPRLPLGEVTHLTVSEDGRRLAFTLTAPAQPASIWVHDLAKEKTRCVVKGALAAGLEAGDFVEPRLIRYPAFDGLFIPAFLYEPPGASPDHPAPVVVYVHGGPEAQERVGFDPIIQFCVGCGYAVLAPNVRGSTGYGRAYTHLDDVRKREDSVRDLESAVAWIRAQAELDGRRVGIVGGSYGGYMVLAALTLYPDLWSAGCDIVGIANFRTFLERTSPHRRKHRESEYGSLEADGEFLDSISPIHRVDRIRAPLMVIHGANDPRVPLWEAEQIVRELERRGRVVEFQSFPDEGHGLAKRKNRIVAYSRLAQFFERHVAGNGR
ncbi:MAG: S9 family peptidase [Planctomycetes bacterium]|nr:S9 family peptidase [Planctomycetota bacterium]